MSGAGPRRGVVVLRHRDAAQHHHGARPGRDRGRQSGRRGVAERCTRADRCSTRSLASPTAGTGWCSSWRPCSCCSPRPSAARSSPCWTPTTTSRTTASESVLARDSLGAGERPVGVAGPGRAGAARRARRQPRGAAQDRARRRRAERPGRRRGGRLSRRRPVRARSRDGRSTYLVATFRDGQARSRWRAAAGAARIGAGGDRGRRRARRRPGRPSRSRRTSRGRRCSPSRCCSCSRCSSSAASWRRCCRCRRRTDDPRHVPRPAAGQRGPAAVDLRAEHGHRARPRAGDRLLPVHPLALPRGAGAQRPRAASRCGARSRPPAAPCCSAR